MKKIILTLLLFCGLLASSFAAVGCDLNDPDRDILRIGAFYGTAPGPRLTYKTEYLSLTKLGGEKTLRAVEERLGDKFSGLYETIDVPYTLYTLYQGDQIIGYIHGINQKGKYGGLQVFLAYDTAGSIKHFYYQKLTSRQAAELRSPEFAAQFSGLSLQDFLNYAVQTGSGGSSKVQAIKNPSPEDAADFQATLRAVKKNLILMDIFVFNKSQSISKGD
ncbi:hypothetical protein NO2_0993 [Candidatus Termititenax persephonae]|uniref:Lipoprotein n=1 Tax=Candidatus Termititenax persephonae TaxID=2218525 RepID=A0A388THT2_9BACT|nr:hypothetical protein NO2_0993 [Candidatus Termititenax persephonae]